MRADGHVVAVEVVHLRGRLAAAAAEKRPATPEPEAPTALKRPAIPGPEAPRNEGGEAEAAAATRRQDRGRGGDGPRHHGVDVFELGRHAVFGPGSSPWQCYYFCWRMRYAQKKSEKGKKG